MNELIRICGYLLILAIGASVKPMYEFLYRFIKSEQKNTYVTQKDLDDKAQQFYCDFVKKETYNEHRQAVEEEFKAFRTELKEIKQAQTSQTGKIAEIDKNIALIQKDFSYLCKALDNMPKRKED